MQMGGLYSSKQPKGAHRGVFHYGGPLHWRPSRSTARPVDTRVKRAVGAKGRLPPTKRRSKRRRGGGVINITRRRTRIRHPRNSCNSPQTPTALSPVTPPFFHPWKNDGLVRVARRCGFRGFRGFLSGRGGVWDGGAPGAKRGSRNAEVERGPESSGLETKIGTRKP